MGKGVEDEDEFEFDYDLFRKRAPLRKNKRRNNPIGFRGRRATPGASLAAPWPEVRPIPSDEGSW